MFWKLYQTPWNQRNIKHIIPGGMIGIILLVTPSHISSFNNLFRQSPMMDCEIAGYFWAWLPLWISFLITVTLSLITSALFGHDWGQAFLLCLSEHCRMLEMERPLGTFFAHPLSSPTPWGAWRAGNVSVFIGPMPTELRSTPKSRIPDHPCFLNLLLKCCDIYLPV